MSLSRSLTSPGSWVNDQLKEENKRLKEEVAQLKQQLGKRPREEQSPVGSAEKRARDTGMFQRGVIPPSPSM